MSRAALLERLRARPIALISGPAGAGKTVLAGAWLAGEPDARLLRLSRFHNTTAALSRAILTAVAAPEPEDDAWWPDHLSRFARGLLVLDGAEVITDPQARLFLRDLVEFRPPGLRLGVTTREAGPDWLARRRACGDVTTITAADLRLPHGDPEPAGLAVAVDLYTRLGAAQAREAIGAYLRTEVLARVTTEVRYLLLAASVTDGVDPALAIHLTGNPAAGRLLARFADSTQFATVGDDHVVRLHPLLARTLADELATDHDTTLRRRHAGWLADRGRLDESTGIHVELADVATAEAELMARWQRAVLSGHAEIVLDALARLPPRATDARLAVVAAMAHLSHGNLREWRRWLDVAEATGPDVELEPGLTVGMAAAIARNFAAALTTGPPVPTVDGRGLWSAISEVATGLRLLWTDDLAGAAVRLHRAETASRAAGDQLALAHALSGLALSSTGADAELFATEALAIELPTRCRWVVANAHLALAGVHLSAGDRAAARAAAAEALATLDGAAPDLEPRTRSRALEVLRDLAPTRSEGLSSRERRVLRALCGPLTLREIADELFVSHNTVKSQVSSIYRKLGVQDRAAAVAAARSGKG